MTKSRVSELLSKREDERLEFKAMINLDNEHHKREIVKNIISMANAKGGQIVIGFDEKTRTIVGVPEELEDKDRFWQIITSRCHPPVDFQFKLVECEDRTVAVLIIPESKIKPHHNSDRNVWIRRGAITDKADPREIAYMLSTSQQMWPGIPSEIKTKDEHEETGRSVRHEIEAGIFEIPHGTAAYRSCRVFGPFADPGIFAVFLPTFDRYRPTPEFGGTRSVLLLEERDIRILDSSPRAILDFFERLEAIPYALSPKFAVWDITRLYWTLKDKDILVYGMGASQALQALRDYSSGVFNGIIHFGFGDLYNPTALIIISLELSDARGEELIIRTLDLKLMLSTIPTDWELIQKIFLTYAPLRGSLQQILPLQPEACTLRKIGYLEWWPKRVNDTRVPFRPIGIIGRDLGSKPEYNLPQGIIVQSNVFQNVNYELDTDDSWLASWYGKVFDTAPIHCFDEIPVTLTNPIPSWGDIIEKTHTHMAAPSIRQVVFGALGGCVVSCLNFHSYPLYSAS